MGVHEARHAVRVPLWLLAGLPHLCPVANWGAALITLREAEVVVPLSVHVEPWVALGVRDVSLDDVPPRAKVATRNKLQHGLPAVGVVLDHKLTVGVHPDLAQHEVVGLGGRRHERELLVAGLELDPGPAHGVHLEGVSQELCLWTRHNVVRPVGRLRVRRPDGRMVGHLLREVLPVLALFAAVQLELEGLAEDGVEGLPGPLGGGVDGDRKGGGPGHLLRVLSGLGGPGQQQVVLHDLRHLLQHRGGLHEKNRNGKHRSHVGSNHLRDLSPKGLALLAHPSAVQRRIVLPVRGAVRVLGPILPGVRVDHLHVLVPHRGRQRLPHGLDHVPPPAPPPPGGLVLAALRSVLVRHDLHR
mmetsp:Transcript_6563/g.22613  ORF Transcript_6563/g.22613 Transcript_6563/m.22613 type:complete len:357 (+) Transcript_6563:974-2044(+)